MAPRKYKCNQCDKTHKKPINEQCPSLLHNDSMESVNGDQQQNSDVSSQILAELQKLNGRIATVEEKVQNNAQKLSNVVPQVYNAPVTQHQVADASNVRSRHSSVAGSSVQSQDVVVPSLQSLQTSQRIQAEVDERLRHLAHLSTDQGKLKSQRGGSDNIYVKKQIPWPQNHILGGQAKARVSYDGLSWCQWMAGFATIAREESDLDTKTAMLEYLADLMEDAHDFSWASAKGSHAVLLCKMEEGKIQWTDTHKIDRIRRAHAQRFTQPNSQSSQKKSDNKGMPCKFFQKGSCQHKTDHESGSNFYKHICSICASQGKEYRHAAKDCRVSRPKNESGTAKMQCQT